MRSRVDEHGTVMVETLLAFVPLLTLFLGIVQYTLLASAQLVVHHAAVAGARSASVVLDDDPARYGGAEPLAIGGRPEGSRAAQDALLAIAAAVFDHVPDAPEQPLTPAPLGYGARVSPIRNAVYAKLAAIVPARALAGLAGSPDASVLEVLGRSPALRLAQAPLYLPVTTAITFPRAPGSRELFEQRVEDTTQVTVRVTHLATCTIPLVAALVCRALSGGEHAEELELAPAAGLQRALAEAGARAIMLQAEASMPLQRAPYRYASEDPP